MPGRVHSLQVKNAVGRRFGQGLLGNLFFGLGQIAFNSCNLVHAHIHSRCRCGVEADEPAAHEIVGHFILDGIYGSEGIGRFVAEGEYFLGTGFFPFCVVCAGGVESFHMVGRNTGNTAAVCCAVYSGYSLYEFGSCLVIRAGGGDDAVAVELGFGKNLHVVGGIFQGDALFLQLQVLKDLTGRCKQAGTIRIVGIELVEGHGVAFFQKVVRILDDAG